MANDKKPLFCPHCKGQDIIKAGYRLSVRSGKKQRYQCTTCYKTFYGEEE